MVQMKDFSANTFGLVLSLTAAATPLAGTIWIPGAIAAPTFPMPSKVQPGTTVKVRTANSMAGVSNALKQQFETQFSGSKVDLATVSSQTAIDAVLSGKTDLAAIGRPLTAAEKQQGLRAIPVGRDKIAIVVGSANGFKKDITIPQFAKMFRGEIKNWSILGGPNTAIQFVDRVNSDTRQSFLNYPAFKNANFATGANAVKLEDTGMKALADRLGKAGVSFVPVNQLKAQKALRALTMHGTEPTNPKYPFSQALFYVYKGDQPNAAVQAFLGLAGSPTGQKAIQQSGIAQAIDFNKPGAIAKATGEASAPVGTASLNAPADGKAADGKAADGAAANGAAADGAAADGTAADGKAVPSGIAINPQTAPTGTTSGTTGSTDQAAVTPGGTQAGTQNQVQGESGFLGLNFPGWDWLKWLLPLGLLGLGLLLLLLPRKEDESYAEPNEMLAGDGDDRRRGLTEGVAGVTHAVGDAARDTAGWASDGVQAGGAAIAGGAAAVTAGAGAAWARFREDDNPVQTEEWNVTGDAWEDPQVTRQPSEPNTFLGDLKGKATDAATGASNWANDATQAGGAAIAGGAAAATGAAAAAWSFISGKEKSETAEAPIDLGANWQASAEIPETTAFTAPETQWDFGNTSADVNLSNPDSPRLGDAIGEVRGRLGDMAGTVGTTAENFAGGVRETATNLTSEGGSAVTNLFGRVKEGVTDLTSGAAQVGGDALATGTTAVGGAAAAIGGTAAAARARLSGEDSRSGGSRIVLIPQTAREAIVRWQLSEEQKSYAHSRGGMDLALRLYDCTGLNPDSDRLENYYQYDCSELTQELRIEVPVPDRNYVVEVGYLDRVGEWMGIARSLTIRMPTA
jgi:ABC-type phosphate transport system substrate-binding protein